jgi:hypothetical protein
MKGEYQVVREAQCNDAGTLTFALCCACRFGLLLLSTERNDEGRKPSFFINGMDDSKDD